MEAPYKTWFRNLTDLPPEDTPEFLALRKQERDRCLGGITVNGIYISGWLYWHLNHWHIIVDTEDEFGNVDRTPAHPDLRDNEWERAEGIEMARKEKKGYMETGARQLGKSEMEASMTAYTAILFPNSQSVLVGGNAGDIGLLTEKIDFGMKHMWAGLAVPKLDNDWRKKTVRLGYKDKNNKDHVYSYIMVRNAEEGNNTEAPAGTTAKGFIMDEVAKYPFSQTFSAAKPAFVSKFGWRCVPILVCTGGSFEKGADAERFFYNPEANNFISFKDEATGKVTAKFMSGIYRMGSPILRVSFKRKMSLADYLRNVKGIELTEDSELKEIEIDVADEELARDIIAKERALKAKDPDVTEYLKEIMYSPLTPEECFLTSSKNFYNGELAKIQKTKILENDIKAECVELYDDGEKIVCKPVTDRFPISTFPVKAPESTDAPIQIWEQPVASPPYGLYCAGVDPYAFNEAESSDSLGAVYIFKRMHDIHSESFQDCFVASYVARPKTKKEWNEQAKLLIQYYNAQALVENDQNSFCEYMMSEGLGHLVEDEPGWLKEGQPINILGRGKGISRAAKKTINTLRDIFKEYMEEKLTDIKGTDGQVVGKVLGISQIYDPMLCEEIAKWNYDGNFDREVAASLAVAQAKKMDKLRIRISEIDDKDIVKEKRKPRPLAPFSYTSRNWRKRPIRPFKTRL